MSWLGRFGLRQESRGDEAASSDHAQHRAGNSHWALLWWRSRSQTSDESGKGRGAMGKTNKGEITPKQQELFIKFKERIKDIIKPEHDDYSLQKWCKARCWDINKSETMFRNSMAFREKMKSDMIRENYVIPEVLEKYLAGGFVGYDKEGSPLKVELYGALDMKGLMYSSKKSDLEKTKIHQCESIVQMWKEQTKLRGHRVDGLVVVFDMEHTGTRHLWRPALNMYIHLVNVLEDNYPEMMKHLFVINAPRIFPVLWKLGRPLISEDMKNKIHVLGSDYKQELLKHIDVSQLPAYLGGELTDPDGNPRCATMVCQGGEVPRHYYLSEVDDTEGMETCVLPRGDKLKMDFFIEKPGSILRWEFRTEDYDIGFGVTYLREAKNGKKEEYILPVRRVNAHQIAQDDSLTCEESGTYAVVFDNSYSWSRSKGLHYLVEIHTIDDMGEELDGLSSGGSWTRLVKNMQITHL